MKRLSAINPLIHQSINPSPRLLTARQRQILDFIQRKQESERLTPTLREIAAHFRFSSPNAALCHVQALLAKGFLKSLPGRARALQVTSPDESTTRRPRV